MDKPAICVVVPVWGAEKTLGRCVDSILAQQVDGGVCCVLVDDGSPDRCGEICDEYAARDARVQVIHQADSGVSGARNAGLGMACAEYVVFLDSDDALRPGALQAALSAQRSAPGSLVIWRYSTEEADPAPVDATYTIEGQSALPGLYLGCLIAMPWNKLYRCDLAQLIKFNTAYTLGEDLQFVLDYIALLGRRQPGFTYAVMHSALTFYDCSRGDGTLSTRYHPEYCDIWPEHFAKLSAACTDAGAAPDSLLPLHRAQLRVYAEGVADILRRDPLPVRQRRAKARAALNHPWLRALLRQMKAERCYSPYYLPCLWKSTRLLYALAEAARSQSPLFGKMDWAGYYLLLGRRRRA